MAVARKQGRPRSARTKGQICVSLPPEMVEYLHMSGSPSSRVEEIIRKTKDWKIHMQYMTDSQTITINGETFAGEEAIEAWENQDVRCNCGRHGTYDWRHTVEGTAGDQPAKWLGCPSCKGQALGVPLVMDR